MESSNSSKASAGWWRWLLMPFAAFIGATLAAIAFTLLQWLGMKFGGGFSEDGWYYRYILPAFSAGFFGYFYVLITLKVAPRGKVISAIVMTTILGVLSLLGLVAMWSHSAGHVVKDIQSTVGTIVYMTVAIIAITQLKDEHRE